MMNNSMIAITANTIQKSFKKASVLNDVSFEVKQGQVFALLGPNGAGKTTIINILTTLIPADKGAAMVAGFNVATQADKVRQHISLTGQFAAIDTVLTARENLMLIGRLRHVQNPATMVESLLHQFNLSESADRPASTFSGGMLRRLDIAMSFIGDPAIIFLDEPTTGLDPQSRTMMWDIIKDLSNHGKTIFLTTQYLEEADQLADRIAILNHGHIIAQGTAGELKQLLPQGQIELQFYTGDELDKAEKLLHHYGATKNSSAYSLLVTTDGSIKQMADILNRLEAAKVQISEFAQKTPTLDEAFMKIISNHEENHHVSNV